MTLYSRNFSKIKKLKKNKKNFKKSVDKRKWMC